jgi:signal transduction histidine kinase
VARAYLTDALDLYRRWGAKAKVKAMRQRYGELLADADLALLREVNLSGPRATTTARVKKTEMFENMTSMLDLNTVVKASQAVSSEIVHNRLLEKLMKIMMENAGAQSGTLVLDRGGELFIDARGSVERGAIDVGRSIPVTSDSAASTLLPLSLVTYVARTHQDVVINDASADPQYAHDPYVVNRQPRSILCSALLHQGKLTGVLYLENNLSAGAFTPDRAQFLKLLSNQLAISIENSRLYNTMEQRVVERTKELQDKNLELADTLKKLQDAKDQIVAKEKLAYLGTLTAGIAHEIKNPLNFIKNFSELSSELVRDLSNGSPGAGEELREALVDLGEFMQKIAHHSSRADNIVSGMLMLSREKSGERRSTDLNALVDQYVHIAYRGLQAADKSYELDVKTDYDRSVGELPAIPETLGRAFLNVVNNACFAAQERKRESSRSDFVAQISVTTRAVGDKVEVRIRDNGKGIPTEALEHIFNPFFTTKKPGEGTGLGLSITYDIVVKEHQGEIAVDTQPGEFTEFIITLPRAVDHAVAGLRSVAKGMSVDATEPN